MPDSTLNAPRASEARRTSPAPEPEPRRGAEHDRMGAFAGRWQAEGKAFGPSGAEERMVSDETWEWLPGGFFLVCRFDSRVGEEEHRGFGYMGYEPEHGHFVRLIDNLGYDRRYSLFSNGRVWTFHGERERATYEFSEDGRSIAIAWDQAHEGDWAPLCRLRATRTGGLGPTAH